MTLSCLYRFALNEQQREKFEVKKKMSILEFTLTLCFQDAVQFCNKYEHLIPMKFILAFYVAKVVSRWWSQYKVSWKPLLFDLI